VTESQGKMDTLRVEIRARLDEAAAALELVKAEL
jgi:hypothetical protein